MGFFSKISAGLKKTRDSISGAIGSMLSSFTRIDEELFEELEEILIMSDIGMATSSKICDILRERVKAEGVKDPELIKSMLGDIISEMLIGDNSLKMTTKPSVLFVIGVNGDDMMSSAAVYAPYMPVVPTQLLGYADGAMS